MSYYYRSDRICIAKSCTLNYSITNELANVILTILNNAKIVEKVFPSQNEHKNHHSSYFQKYYGRKKTNGLKLIHRPNITARSTEINC